jgi:lipoprotein NlpI
VIDYLRGSISEAALLADAKRSQDTRDLSQVCEAHFYMAEDALLRQHGDASALFRLAAKECPPNFHEYEGAVAELKAQASPPVAVSAAAAASAAR